MHILVARPEPGAGEMARALEAKGHRATIEPLLDVVLHPQAVPDLAAAAGLIATSRNGLRALAASPQLKDALKLPVYVVGQATGTEARRLGFACVIEGPSDAHALALAILRHPSHGKGPLVHLAGEALAYDVKGALEEKGVSVLQPTVYATRPAARFSAATEALIRDRAFDAVVLMSPRTADTYVALVRAAGLLAAARAIACLCLSGGVARRLAPLSPQRTLIAAAPNAAALMSLVESL